MSKTVKLGCCAPIFMPHCNKYNQITGCMKEESCNYQYDYQEYHNSVDSDKLGSIYDDGKQHCDESCEHCNPEQMLCYKNDPPRRIDKPYQTCIDETQVKHKKRSD